jgi:hypothetical protein
MWFAPGNADPKINPAIQLSDCQRHPLPPTAISCRSGRLLRQGQQAAGAQLYAATLPYTLADHVRSTVKQDEQGR